MGRSRRISVDDILLGLGIVALLGIASNLINVSTDRAALIAAECDLFYGSIDASSVSYCLREMHRRHDLPTSDESILTPSVSSSEPADRRK